MDRVRVADALDPLALTGVRAASWQAAYRLLLPRRYLAALRDRLHLFPSGTWVAERDGEPVGYIATDGGHPASREPPPHKVEILELYVQPEHWRSGLGGALLGAARESLAFRGAGELFLWVLEANSNARRFYQGRGFLGPLAAKEVRVDEDVLPALLYRLPLP